MVIYGTLSCQAIKLNKWLDRSIDNESEIFDINFIDYIYLLSSEKQTLFLRKLFELHRTNILIIDYKYLERIKLHPKEIDKCFNSNCNHL